MLAQPTHFTAGAHGRWQITAIEPVIGGTLPAADRLAVGPPGRGAWQLSGIGSNLRYTTADERDALQPVSAPLDRGEALHGVLIPISKSTAWWALAQDERRAIYARSGHFSIGKEYLPEVARKLYHCRDLGGEFDFLTWFEFAPEHQGAFDKLLKRLRETEEWRHVAREVEVRLVRATDGEAPKPGE